MRDDEAALTAAIIAFATEYGRYGYRRIAAMLRDAGWVVNIKRVERIWRREGLKVPQKQPKRGRLWLNDGSCIRLRPLYPNHIWSYDFVEDRTHNGRKYRMLNVIDEFTRECLAIRVNRKLRSTDVIDALSDLFILRGIPGHIRSDNGPEFVAMAVREWIAAVEARQPIERGSPWENGFVKLDSNSVANSSTVKSFTLCKRPRVIIAKLETALRPLLCPHSSLGYRPPAPEAFMPARPAPQSGPAAPHSLTLAPRPSLNEHPPPDHSIGAGRTIDAVPDRASGGAAYYITLDLRNGAGWLLRAADKDDANFDRRSGPHLPWRRAPQALTRATM